MLSSASRLVRRSQGSAWATKPVVRSDNLQARKRSSLPSIRTIVTNYDHTKAYSSLQKYTIFNTLERAKSIDRTKNIGANVVATRLRTPLQINELKDAMDFLQAKHSKLQYATKVVVEGGGVYGLLGTALPLEVVEKQEDDEAHLQEAMESLLRSPMVEHLLKVKVLSGPDSCDIVIGVNNAAADLPSTGMLVDELLTRYAALIQDPSAVSTEVTVAPIVDDLSNIFPSSYRTSFMGWKGIVASMKCFTRATKALSFQSPLRFSSEPSQPSFFTLELSPELTKTLEQKSSINGSDILSAIAAGTSLAAKKKLFKFAAVGSQDINIDLHISHDIRADSFIPPFPNETMMLAEVPSYHCLKSVDEVGERGVWDVAKDIFNSTKDAISSDQLFESYHFSVTSASVRARKLGSIPTPPFTFQDAGNMYISPRTIDRLAIDDIRVAETAIPGLCKVIVGKFNRKLQLSFNFQDEAMSVQEAEVITDCALELLRGESSATKTE